MTQRDSELVKIGARQELDSSEAQASGLSRRKFLKVLGAGSATAAVAGCARDQKQNLYNFVKGDADQIPGVAVWYRSSCRECAAGCGIQVRTREGRAVKVEGNPEHPVNKGGLCALGQASLQALYDPDRVRQPLVRDGGTALAPIFKPISWDEAYAKVGAALKSTAGKKVLITGEERGALEELLGDFAKSGNVDWLVYDSMQPVALAKASELVYGLYGIPRFDFEAAEAIVNFGADFLETWISPVEYARGWAKSRKTKTPAKFFHIEPRLSLTGANADAWLNAKPGTEIRIALAMLKVVLESGRTAGLRDEVKESLRELTHNINVQDVANEAEISAGKLLQATQALLDAKASLVIAGGTSAATPEAISLQTVVAFLNLALGNVGKTVDLAGMRRPRSSMAKVANAVDSMNKGEVSLVMVQGCNPLFNLPTEMGFRYALQKVKVGAGNAAGLVVSFSSSLDETAQLADLIIPSSHALESWGDDRPMPGVYSLIQPSMTPVFDTRSFGDILLGLASVAGLGSVAGGASDYQNYLKNSWKKIHSSEAVKSDFARFWLESVELGGYFAPRSASDKSKGNVSSEALKISAAAVDFADSGAGSNDLVLYPFNSVKSFDGRAANRPWLQELPDPITSLVWDAWAELHSETAKKLGIAQGDVVQIRNKNGELNLPVYVTDYVRKDVVAVPLGQGHSAYGRIASQLSAGGNVFGLLPSARPEVGSAALSTLVKVNRGRGRINVVKTQGSDSQIGRGIAKTMFVGGAAHAADSHGAHGHHEPKQMYVQREHPVYEWGMAVDLSACTGCGACVVACYAENNIAVVGRETCSHGREMSWLRIDRYFEGEPEELQVSFQPMMCQHCHNAPCEPVCPVYATYHNEEGLNAMIYNRCVGTRYCSNNCSYKVRRFNFFEYDIPEPLTWQLNPDVTKRTTGIMEKCSFCIQRINEAKDHAKDEGRLVKDGEIQPACVQSCPTQALVFGNTKDPNSAVSRLSHEHRAYKVLDHHINTQPAVSYLERIKNKL
jgi:anaerobic selenocysteine-containing dehydrogenase/Fe-S-cluster-containing dehydrogenase component